MIKNDNTLNGFTSNLQADINENQALIEAYNLIEKGEFLKAEDVLTKQLEKLNSTAYADNDIKAKLYWGLVLCSTKSKTEQDIPNSNVDVNTLKCYAVYLTLVDEKRKQECSLLETKTAEKIKEIEKLPVKLLIISSIVALIAVVALILTQPISWALITAASLIIGIVLLVHQFDWAGRGRWGLIAKRYKLYHITVPERKSENKLDSLFIWRKFLTLKIEDNENCVFDHAFDKCYDLISVTILGNVTSIGAFAFSDCYNLLGITIPSSVNIIGSFAFDNCTNLAVINYGGTKAEWDAVEKQFGWAEEIKAFYVTCIDGSAKIEFENEYN